MLQVIRDLLGRKRVFEAYKVDRQDGEILVHFREVGGSGASFVAVLRESDLTLLDVFCDDEPDLERYVSGNVYIMSRILAAARLRLREPLTTVRIKI